MTVNKYITSGVGMLAAALTFCGTIGSAMAQQERSGKVLSEIVNRVDQKLTALEAKTTQQNQTRAAVDEKLKSAAGRYRGAEKQFDKHEAKTEVIENLSTKNVIARDQVGATLNTMISVVTDMEGLSEELKKSGMTPEQLQAQRERVANVINGVAPLIAAIEADAPVDQAQNVQLAGTKQTLVMLYQQLSSPLKGAGSVYGQVEQTVDALQDVAAQLRIVKEVLDQQRFMLQLAAHNEVVWLALWRLQQTQLGDTKIKEMAGVYMDDIMQDNEAYGDILTDTALGNADASDTSPEASDVWDTISQGNVQVN